MAIPTKNLLSLKIHHTIQFNIPYTAVEHAMRCRQLFAPDVIAYAFQIDEPVSQNKGKENGKERGYGSKRYILHSSIHQSYRAKHQQGQFINEKLRGFRTKRNISVYMGVLHGFYLWIVDFDCSSSFSMALPFLSDGTPNGMMASLMLSRYSSLVLPSRASFQSL